MNDEDLLSPPLTGPAQEIVKHFMAEKDVSKERDVNELLAYAFDMKQQKEEAEKEYKLAMEKIKAAWKIDAMEGKKQILSAGDYNLIVTKRAPSCKVDWESWAVDMVGETAFKELEQTKALVKEGKATSKYIDVGKEVTAVEIVKKETGEFPF